MQPAASSGSANLHEFDPLSPVATTTWNPSSSSSSTSQRYPTSNPFADNFQHLQLGPTASSSPTSSSYSPSMSQSNSPWPPTPQPQSPSLSMARAPPPPMSYKEYSSGRLTPQPQQQMTLQQEREFNQQMAMMARQQPQQQQPQQRSNSFSVPASQGLPQLPQRPASVFVGGGGGGGGGYGNGNGFQPQGGFAAASSPRARSEEDLQEWLVQDDVDEILAMFPDVLRSAVVEDIRSTKSKDQTVNNILDGRLPLAPPTPAPAPVPAPAPARAQNVFVNNFNPAPPPLFRQGGNSDGPPGYDQIDLMAETTPVSRNSSTGRNSLPAVNGRLLEEYEQLDRQIAQLTASNIDSEYQLAVHNLDNLNGLLQAAQARYNLLQKQT